MNVNYQFEINENNDGSNNNNKTKILCNLIDIHENRSAKIQIRYDTKIRYILSICGTKFRSVFLKLIPRCVCVFVVTLTYSINGSNIWFIHVKSIAKLQTNRNESWLIFNLTAGWCPNRSYLKVLIEYNVVIQCVRVALFLWRIKKSIEKMCEDHA